MKWLVNPQVDMELRQIESENPDDSDFPSFLVGMAEWPMYFDQFYATSRAA